MSEEEGGEGLQERYEIVIVSRNFVIIGNVAGL